MGTEINRCFDNSSGNGDRWRLFLASGQATHRYVGPNSFPPPSQLGPYNSNLGRDLSNAVPNG